MGFLTDLVCCRFKLGRHSSTDYDDAVASRGPEPTPSAGSSPLVQPDILSASTGNINSPILSDSGGGASPLVSDTGSSSTLPNGANSNSSSSASNTYSQPNLVSPLPQQSSLSNSWGQLMIVLKCWKCYYFAI